MLFTFIIIILLSWFLVARYRRMTLLHRLGIPGPTPNLIFGNTIQIEKIGRDKIQTLWREKYGPIFGYYDGGNPFVMVTDVSDVKKIQFTDYQYFINRVDLPKGGVFPGVVQKGLAFERGASWIIQRRLMSYLFTTSKINALSKTVIEVVDKFLDDNLISGATIDWKSFYQQILLKITFKTMFVNMDKYLTPQVEELFMKIPDDLYLFDPLSVLLILFPELSFILYPLRQLYLKIQSFGNRPMWQAEKLVRKLYDERLRSNKPEEDFLQYLIDTRDDAADKKSKKLSEIEILGNLGTLIVASMETTASALTFATHYLIKDKEFQDKIRNGDSDLWNALLFETLRMHPNLALMVARECAQDYQINDKMTIPKGCIVQIGVHSLHQDNDLWNDPQSFNLDHFSDKNQLTSNYSFQGFGNGRRSCVGIKSAQMVFGNVITRILSRYELIKSDKTNMKDLQIDYKFPIAELKYGVFSSVTKIREEE